jgi:hypothetical protein
MRRLLVIENSTLRLLDIPGEPGMFEFREFSNPADAERLLAAFSGNTDAMQRLRRLLAETIPTLDAHRLSDQQVIAHVAVLVQHGPVCVAEKWRPRKTLVEATEPEEAAPPPKTTKRKLTWIEILTINDLTGDPLPWVRMQLTLPTGDKDYYTTDKDGLIRVEDLDPSTCDAKCDLDNAQLADTLAFVAMGKKTDQPKFKSGSLPDNSSIKRIAEIEEHKVKKGETLDALAKKAGMTWEDLAMFNWGVSTPGEINEKLRDEVGCTKKTKDGANYVFDDSDNPGIVFVPKKWEETGLATGKQHVVRVKPAGLFPIMLEDEFGHRIPETDFEVTFADNSQKKGKLGLSGIYGIKDPPPGPIGVVYPDLDDINIKSLAACARECFDTKDYEHIYRVMEQGPKVIEQVIKAYDKYFNTYTGKGLVEDIYQDLTEDLALVAAVGMMARAGIKTRENAEYIEWTPFEEEEPGGGEQVELPEDEGDEDEEESEAQA